MHSTEVLLPEGGDDALANIRRGKPGPLQIVDWPISKTIVVPSDTTRGLSLEYAIITFDAHNAIENVELEGIFKDYVEENHISRVDYAHQIIAKVWSGSNNLPPPIP